MDRKDSFMDIVSMRGSSRWSVLQITCGNKNLKNTKLALKDWIKSLPSTLIVRNQALNNLAVIQLDMEVSKITAEMLEKEKMA